MKKYFSKITILIGCVLLCMTFTIAAFAAVVSTKYNPNNVTATNEKTANDINEYIDSINSQNMQLSKTTLDDVITTVTFSRSMSAADLEAYVEAYDIEIVQLQARGYDKYGNRITFFSKTDKGFEETFRMLNELAESDDVEFAGAIGLYALTSATSVTAIQADNRTLLIDTSADQYYNNEKAVSGSERNAAVTAEDVSYIFANSIAWDAEDSGLVYYEVTD